MRPSREFDTDTGEEIIMLKGGVCGFGWAGQDLTKRIRRFYADKADIVAVCNRSQGRLDTARDQFGISQLTHDVNELVNWDLDFLAVMSTSFAHYEQVMAGARAGLPMLIEKPIAMTLQEADEMIEAVESRGLVNIVNYSLRHAPLFYGIKQWIDEGYFGPIKTITVQMWRGRDFWANGMRYKVFMHPEEFGTWLIHHMCHALDLVYWLTGQPFKEIYCVTDTTKPGSDEEEIMWSVGRLADGTTFQVSDAATGMARESVGIQGLRRSMWYDSGQKTPRMYVKEEGQKLEHGQEVPIPDPPPGGGNVAHLMEVLTEGKPSRASLRDARVSLAAAIAAKISARENRVVQLSELDAKK
ncbi:MAG: Inositol 2-dehydrogenase/D-chiro-inositol 3-dehydrogenase [Phycisphaerae bacterium]|nr:Inositol 2-dehydrogenase/D-chiro-inositol 3-dehydrogenase [Phycisphaerae bacterium]